MGEIQRYVLLRLMHGWKAVSNSDWSATLYAPERSTYRKVTGRTIKSLFDKGWITHGNRRDSESYWVVTQLGEQALNGKNKRTAGI